MPHLRDMFRCDLENVGSCCGLLQREVSKKLHVRLPELSVLLDRTLAKAPKEQFGPPSAQIWKRIVVRHLAPPALSLMHFLHF